jgi:hypothetical protein
MGPLLHGMIEHRSAYHLRRGELTQYRMWRGATRFICTDITLPTGQVQSPQLPQDRFSSHDARKLSEISRRVSLDVDGEGLPVNDSPGNRAQALKTFLLNYRFDHATDHGSQEEELPPIICAAAEGSVMVVRALLDARADPSHRYCGRTVVAHLGFISGVEPLHLAVGSCASQATIHTLLAHGADPNVTVSDVGLSPLAAGAYMDSAEGILGLHQACNELNLTL